MCSSPSMTFALSCGPNPTCDTSVDYLKIPGIFVKDIKSNLSDCAIVKSINEIGHFMGKKMITEYVKDDEVL